MRTIIGLACLLSVMAMPANAKQPLNFEITPLIGYRFGGDFNTIQNDVRRNIELKEDTSYGLLTAWSFDRKRQGEFLISHYNTSFSEAEGSTASNTDLSVTYFHIGGNVPITEGVLPLFVTGGLGLAHLAPKGVGMSKETRFSANVGLASKISLSEHFSLRLDSRLYGTFFNTQSSIFCGGESCAMYISGDIWFQSEVSVGLTYSF